MILPKEISARDVLVPRYYMYGFVNVPFQPLELHGTYIVIAECIWQKRTKITYVFNDVWVRCVLKNTSDKHLYIMINKCDASILTGSRCPARCCPLAKLCACLACCWHMLFEYSCIKVNYNFSLMQPTWQTRPNAITPCTKLLSNIY